MSSSGWNIGVDLGFGGINNIGLSASQSQGHSKGDETTHQLTEISAQNKLTLESGQDTALLGAQLKGETVALNVGQNLKIESLQNESRYEEKNNSSGIGINFGIGGGKLSKPSISGAASKSEIDASYHGVTEQSGIFAGSGGFAIEVGKDTALKGGVIASEAAPDKNKLSTETLHVEDIHNETEYEGDSKGIGVQTGEGTKYNEQGITPSIGVKAEGKAESETKAAIAPGTIEIRSDQDKDLSGLNRDTENALNRLGEIFDKTKVEEQQELAEQFGKAAFAEVHKLGEKMGWKEGGPEKIALHAAVGAIMAKLGGAEASAGATGAAVNEAMIKEIAKIKDPALAQWVSYAIGAAAAKAAGGNEQSGGSAAASGMKNNYLFESQKEQRDREIEEARKNGLTEAEIAVIQAKWEALDVAQDAILSDMDLAQIEGSSEMERNIENAAMYNLEHPNNTLVMGIAQRVYQSQSWSRNELKSFTIGTDFIKIKGVDVGGAIGYAADEKGNVYGIVMVGGNIGVDAGKITGSDIIKALAKVSASVSSMTTSGEYDDGQLKDLYPGIGISLTQTTLGLDVEVSTNLDIKISGGYGVSNGVQGTGVSVGYLRYIGNIKSIEI